MQIHHIPKVVAPTQHTGQPVLIQSFAFSKSVVLKFNYRNQPVNHLVSGDIQQRGGRIITELENVMIQGHTV